LITKLTDRAVLNYKPEAKRRRIRDALAKSLFLVIEPSGTKSWQMRFRTPSGRIGKLTLGRVDFSGRDLKDDPEIGQPLTLAAARQLAAKVHRERELGHDPIADHKARKHRQRAELIDRSNNTRSPPRRALMLRSTPSSNSGAGLKPRVCWECSQTASSRSLADWRNAGARNL
jgi:Arm DNA-binding domain